jgi:co-chaperonin GroES (HSP10)
MNLRHIYSAEVNRMEVHPLNNYILLEPASLERKTPGGLYLPDKIDEDARWFRVIKAGPGLPDMFGNIQRLDYEPGEYVYVFPHAVHKVNLKDYGPYPDEEITFVSEGDVLVRSKDPKQLLFTPVGSYCIITKIKSPERTAGGIYLPDKSVPPPAIAKVVSVGTGYRTAAAGMLKLMAQLNAPDRDVTKLIRESVPLNVQPGDTVLIVATAPMKLNLEPFGLKNEYFIVGEADILCKLEVSQ